MVKKTYYINIYSFGTFTIQGIHNEKLGMLLEDMSSMRPRPVIDPLPLQFMDGCYTSLATAALPTLNYNQNLA